VTELTETFAFLLESYQMLNPVCFIRLLMLEKMLL